MLNEAPPRACVRRHQRLVLCRVAGRLRRTLWEASCITRTCTRDLRSTAQRRTRRSARQQTKVKLTRREPGGVGSGALVAPVLGSHTAVRAGRRCSKTTGCSAHLTQTPAGNTIQVVLGGGEEAKTKHGGKRKTGESARQGARGSARRRHATPPFPPPLNWRYGVPPQVGPNSRGRGLGRVPAASHALRGGGGCEPACCCCSSSGGGGAAAHTLPPCSGVGGGGLCCGCGCSCGCVAAAAAGGARTTHGGASGCRPVPEMKG